MQEGRLEAIQLGRGFVWFEARTAHDLLVASQFVEILQTRQHTSIAFPEEVAYRTGLVDFDAFLRLVEAMPTCGYRDHLETVRLEIARGCRVNVETLEIPGALKIAPRAFRDDRGLFFESFRKDRYAAAGITLDFVQDNRSVSRGNVLRGLHYQVGRPQGHLVTLTRGRIFDVGVDLRPRSPAFGKWIAAELTADPPIQLYLPPGVAHGFCVLSDEAEIWYKCTEVYVPGDEGGLLWCDPDLAIPWPIRDPIVNPRDAAFPPLKEIPATRLPQALGA